MPIVLSLSLSLSLYVVIICRSYLIIYLSYANCAPFDGNSHIECIEALPCLKASLRHLHLCKILGDLPTVDFQGNLLKSAFCHRQEIGQNMTPPHLTRLGRLCPRTVV